jgi:hypothetical protein
MSTAELFLAFCGVGMQALLLGVLLWKSLFRSWGWFFTYLIANFARDLLLFAVLHHHRAYFLSYWLGDVVVISLIIMSIYEIFHAVFHNFYKLSWFRFLFPASCLGLIAVASIRSLFSSRLMGTENLLISQIFSLEIMAYILQVGIFFLFLALVQFFRVTWKQYTFGIALGFGVSAAGSLVAFIVRSEFGTKFDPIFRFVVPLTYTIGVAIWLLTFLWPVPKAQLEATAPALTPEAVVTELKQYTRTVKEILKR